MSDNYLLNVYQYWGQGFEKMPSFLKIIYKHNLEFCKKHNINLILIDDNNVYDFITPHPRFKELAYNFKSDIIRYYILHKFGGFWFDTDVIIIKDLNNLYESILNYECMLDVEFNKKIGCASLFIKKESNVSLFCINYINHVLNSKDKLIWDDIGPFTVEELYKTHFSLIKLNNYDIVKNGCNFVCWNEFPGVNKKSWYLQTEECAQGKAEFLKNNQNCFYLITWTIYRINDMKNNLNNMVFNDKKSVFSYFINYEKKKIVVVNAEDNEWNGTYNEADVLYKDNGSLSYVKDSNHHLYRHNGIWRLGNSGVNFYKILGQEINNEIDLNIIKFDLKDDKNESKQEKKYAVMWSSTVNIGDDIQTIAAINFLEKKGIKRYTFIDREKLSDYNGEPVTLIMNGWYMHDINKFPPSNKITPIFISVHINNEFLIIKNINYFKKYEPIGCRDEETVNLFRKYGIKSFFTGCLTLLFDDHKEKTGGKYLVDVNTNCNYIQNIEIDTSNYTDCEIIEHDINKNISLTDRINMTLVLLNKYQKAELVITTRLCCILPCRAFNTKAIFIHKNYKNDPRFQGLKEIINGDVKYHNNYEGNREKIKEIRNNFLNIKI